MTIAGLARAVGGRLSGDGRGTYAGASLNSRTLRPGELFFAVRGARVDGHRFVAAAARQGAAAAVVARRPARGGLPLILVRSVPAALRRGAAWHRASFRLPVIGITGSNGKTTVKDMTAHLFGSRLGSGAVLATRGNLNNQLGLPLSVFGLGEGTRIAVLELAMNHPGEIRRLAAVAAPTSGAILNAGAAHLWAFRGVAGVARAKAELIEALPAGGWAVLNAEDARVWANRGRTAARVLGFGARRGDVRAAAIRLDREGCPRFRLETPSGAVNVRLRVPGTHNAVNAAAAAALAWTHGLAPRAIAAALATFRPAARLRLERRRLLHGATGIVDCYNANPDSFRAAFSHVAALGNRPRVLVLGAMRELGRHGVRAHRGVGTGAAALHPRLVVGVGAAARDLVAAARTSGATHAVWVAAPLDAEAVVREALTPGTVALFKASRAVALEALADKLVEGRATFRGEAGDPVRRPHGRGTA
jgi:UDP-N-acetylmuramoyl-tripeptide--D-alanyl-D-alanine ligase